jgi:hypothetical protein
MTSSPVNTKMQKSRLMAGFSASET